jgi:hypothetical protein
MLQTFVVLGMDSTMFLSFTERETSLLTLQFISLTDCIDASLPTWSLGGGSDLDYF